MSLSFQKSISNLALWYKLTSGNQLLSLSDVPEIIRLRWFYFRDNWEFIKQSYVDLIPSYLDPQKLKKQIDTFSRFVESQRVSKSKKNPFDNMSIISKYYCIFDSTLINSIQLTYEERTIITNKTATITSYTRGDFLAIRYELQKERDQIADRANTTDADYNRVFERSPQIGRVNIKNKDINKMYQIQEAIKSVDFILANSFSLETSTIDPFALARSNANNPEIDIPSYRSGFLSKLNYNEDLQALAARTLGDPDRWIDIAITNGLKAPYIDEVGQKISLISNANQSQINIAEIDINGNLNADKLYIGQVILLQSSTQNFPEQRNILNITQVPISGELVIELSGEPDLSRYKLSENAHMRVFKPNTINSGFFIMIPSLNQLDDESTKDVPWFLQSADGTEKRQKVDLYINDNGDLDFNSLGDIQLSYGIVNATQAIKLKLAVEAGELRRHPEFGLTPIAGNSNIGADQIKQALISSISKMIQVDERYAGIDRLDVVYDNTLDNFRANSISIVLVVRLAGSGHLLPISFTVNT